MDGGRAAWSAGGFDRIHLGSQMHTLRTPASLMGLLRLFPENSRPHPGGSDWGELALVTFLRDRIPENVG